MTFKIKKTSLKWLQKHWNCQKINKVKVLPVKTKCACACARAHVAKSGATENNMYIHVQNLQFDQCRKSHFSA